MMGVLAFIGILFLLFFIVDIILYVLFAYALFKMAKTKKLENAWMACIPILQMYILGKLIKSLNVLGYDIPQIEFVLPVFGIVIIVLNKVPILGTVLSIIYYILTLFVLNKLYKMYDVEKATLFTVLSIFGFPVPFIFMYLKNIEISKKIS